MPHAYDLLAPLFKPAFFWGGGVFVIFVLFCFCFFFCFFVFLNLFSERFFLFLFFFKSFRISKSLASPNSWKIRGKWNGVQGTQLLEGSWLLKLLRRQNRRAVFGLGTIKAGGSDKPLLVTFLFWHSHSMRNNTAFIIRHSNK